MKNKEYYGIYQSPYCNNGEPYIGSPESSPEAVYAACGTDEHVITYFTTLHEAEEYLNTL